MEKKNENEVDQSSEYNHTQSKAASSERDHAALKFLNQKRLALKRKYSAYMRLPLKPVLVTETLA